MGKKGKGKKGKGEKAQPPDPNVLPTPVRSALLDGDVKKVEDWLLTGGKVDAVNLALVPDRGLTLLMLAARSGQSYFVDMLLLRQAKVNLQDTTGTTALMFAAGGGRVAIMRRLLRSGANPRLGNYSGEGPVQYAQQSGEPACLELLKEVDKDWHKPVWLDQSPATPGPGIWAGIL